MKTKSILLLTALLAVGAGSIFCLYFSNVTKAKLPSDPSNSTAYKSTFNITNVSAQTNIVLHASEKTVSVAERRKMNTRERVSYLEALGHVPLDAEIADWELAQETTWWGKRIAPNEFWKNKTVWLSASASSEARRRGRLYPPMPFADDSLPQYADDQETGHSPSPGAEGPNIRFHVTNQENAFWNKFARTHPRPPEDLEVQQMILAERTIELAGRKLALPAEISLDEGDTRVWQLVAAGYPKEAFSKDALFWGYVLKKRQGLESRLTQKPLNDDLISQKIIANSSVHSGMLTGSLTQADVAGANAWKIAYLQRLRRENVDESYITAYLIAWNMNSNEVFNPTKKDP